MKFKGLTFSVALLLSGTFATTVGSAASKIDLEITPIDAPNAGGAPGQGTGCFVVTACLFAVNQRGVVVGTYLDANNVYHGFIRSPRGQYTPVDAPCADRTAGSGNGTVAESINDLGEITGFCIDGMGFTHGFARSPQGAFTEFDALEPGVETVPLFINDEGATAGFVFDITASLYRAFVRYPDGALAVFVGPNSCTLGFNQSPPCYGNEAGYVTLLGASVGNFEDDNLVGYGMIRGLRGNVAQFSVPGGGTSIYQGTGCPGCKMGVNYFGAIAGTYTDDNYVFHGFLRSPDGKITSFDVEGAGTGSFQGTGCFSDCPVSLNDLGAITGSYIDANNVPHGYLRAPDGRSVTIDPQGSVATQPESINDSGAITGFYVDSSGVFHGFLAMPRH